MLDLDPKGEGFPPPWFTATFLTLAGFCAVQLLRWFVLLITGVDLIDWMLWLMVSALVWWLIYAAAVEVEDQ
jgi:hypothetical protein